MHQPPAPHYTTRPGILSPFGVPVSLLICVLISLPSQAAGPSDLHPNLPLNPPGYHLQIQEARGVYPTTAPLHPSGSGANLRQSFLPSPASGSLNLPALQAAASAGNPEAQFQLGVLYATGSSGLPQDDDTALKWLHAAARQGSIPAKLAITQLYQQGEADLSFSWLEESARQGDAGAQLQLAYAYLSGQGIARDETRAAFWFEQAARQGSPEAQTELGNSYQQGRGVPPDSPQALYWFKAAARQEQLEAQLALARMYDNNTLPLYDPAEATYWYQQAAIQEDSTAQSELGLRYLEGRGTRRNTGEALKWLTLAAEKQQPEAQMALICFHLLTTGYLPDQPDRPGQIPAALWLENTALRQSFEMQMHDAGISPPAYSSRGQKNQQDRWHQLACQAYAQMHPKMFPQLPRQTFSQ